MTLLLSLFLLGCPSMAAIVLIFLPLLAPCQASSTLVVRCSCGVLQTAILLPPVACRPTTSSGVNEWTAADHPRMADFISPVICLCWSDFPAIALLFPNWLDDAQSLRTGERPSALCRF